MCEDRRRIGGCSSRYRTTPRSPACREGHRRSRVPEPSRFMDHMFSHGESEHRSASGGVQEVRKARRYLKRLFGNSRIRVVPKKNETADVFVGEEQIGALASTRTTRTTSLLPISR